MQRKRNPIVVMRVIDRLNVGGPAIHAVLTAARLDPQRFRTVLVYGDIEPGEGDMSYLLQRYGVHGHHLPGLRRAVQPLGDAQVMWELYGLMRRERPQVVHTHKSKAGLLGRLAGMLAGVPVLVHTYHGHVLDGYFSPIFRRGLIELERALGLVTARLVTLSPQLRQDLSDRHGIAPRDKFQIVPLGLDLQPFRTSDGQRGRLRRELNLLPRDKLIGVVGRMVPIKDHRLFLGAMTRIAQVRGDICAALVGGGECEAEIRAAIHERGLGDRVTMLGWRRDLPTVYADLDALALTSRSEGTPVAVIEALAAGVPVVATAVGGVPDVLRGGRGALVAPGDEAALALALVRTVDDGEVRARARAQAQRDEVCAEFGIERLCADLGALYEEELRAATGTGLRARVLGQMGFRGRGAPWQNHTAQGSRPSGSPE